jgi:hypothetical protein
MAASIVLLADYGVICASEQNVIVEDEVCNSYHLLSTVATCRLLQH